MAFISRDRILKEGAPTGFWPFVPDLAVEVISPRDRYSEMQEKLVDYFHSGVRLVWVVDPSSRTIAIYSSPTEIRILIESDTLEGERVPAKIGRLAFRKNFNFQSDWKGKYYETKQVMPIVVEESNRFIVVTVYAFYFGGKK